MKSSMAADSISSRRFSFCSFRFIIERLLIEYILNIRLIQKFVKLFCLNSLKNSCIDTIYRSVYNMTMDEKSGVKQTILDKSLELFSAKGYEGVSVSELTEAAGITKPTLYYYFGSKEGVFEA